jgi:hypothetical protein
MEYNMCFTWTSNRISLIKKTHCPKLKWAYRKKSNHIKMWNILPYGEKNNFWLCTVLPVVRLLLNNGLSPVTRYQGQWAWPELPTGTLAKSRRTGRSKGQWAKTKLKFCAVPTPACEIGKWNGDNTIEVKSASLTLTAKIIPTHYCVK